MGVFLDALLNTSDCVTSAMADKTYTVEEVAKHNKEGDLWVSLHGKVLDITKFLDEHPGGEDVLMEGAGSDITQAFEDIGHSDDALTIIEEHVIGTLKDGGSGAAKTSALKASKPVTPKTDSTGYLLPVLIIVLSVVAYFMYS